MASRRPRIKGIVNLPGRKPKPAADVGDKKVGAEKSKEDSKLPSENVQEKLQTEITQEIKIEKSKEENSPPNPQKAEPSVVSRRSRLVKPNIKINLGKPKSSQGKETKNMSVESSAQDETSGRPTGNSADDSTETGVAELNTTEQSVEPEKVIQLVTETVEDSPSSPLPAVSQSSTQQQDPELPCEEETSLESEITKEDELKGSTVATSRFRSRLTHVRPNLSDLTVKRVHMASESEDDLRRSTCLPGISVNNRPEKEVEKNLTVPAETSPTEGLKSGSRQHRPTGRDKENRLSQAKREYRKKFQSGTPERSKMTMFDLIYYNPTTNTLSSNSNSQGKEIVIEEPARVPASGSEENRWLSERAEEEAVDSAGLDPNGEADNTENALQSERGGEQAEGEEEAEDNEGAEDGMPAPRVKVGPDGQLILDEQSLVIETTASKKAKEHLVKSPIVYESGPSVANYGAYMKRKRSSDWSWKETVRFYKALNMVGTDFSMMGSLFSKRSRAELKAKFKKEERMNPELVEEALKDAQQFELKLFADDSESDAENNGDKRKNKKSGEQENNETGKKKGSKDKRGNMNKCRISKERKRNKSGSEDRDILPSQPEAANASQAESSASCSEPRPLKFDLENPLNGLSGEEDEAGAGEDDLLSALAKPTRSGRLPKRCRPFEVTEAERKPKSKKPCPILRSALATPPSRSPADERQQENPESVVQMAIRNNPTLSSAEPGSVIIVTSPAPGKPDQQILQLFVVSPKPKENVVASNSTVGALPSYCVPLQPVQTPQ